MVEYWSPAEPFDVPKNRGLWELKSKTDLFQFKKVSVGGHLHWLLSHFAPVEISSYLTYVFE